MFRRSNKSIMFKILIMILTICTLESLIFTITAKRLAEENLEKIIAQNSKKNIELYSEHIGGWLMERMQEVQVYSNTPIIQSMDWNIIEPYLQKEIEEKLLVYDHFMVADSIGYYNNTLKRNAGNASDRDYFKDAMQGRVTVSAPVFSRTNGKPVTVVAAPIKDSDGNIRGVMGASINLIKLSAMIENLKYNYPNSYSYIIDKNGLIIAHSDEKLIMEENIVEESDIITEEMANSARKILSSDQGTLTYSDAGVMSMNIYNLIPNTDG